ncbi:MAG TPA: hypothetical protein DEE98_05725 [Elusimicrobia bacterium]|nr:MAG: hypothetical protein A2278_00930 [Elusimicrobia bacterium RIFOXYA12_FULL_49_49]OGS11420.1 MAG: hypothetical protein A2386_04865 [Elusimicrobia bacterium RIFOXYB1_FULL_48_9]OGS15047.1 MAG: hypothetical protein A2251_00110 [Elusimicrobia bacterium RIFOXYA2_FULL_47_53]OGS29385.1 MAG: hypothetical protein A2323_00395 [Elusimicrobia bacterium RIFOXYB2_FULL_46_23]HBU69866.1 hypothetical protein [Elusimicrobiota bacterium]
MSFQEFIQLEVKAFNVLKSKDPDMVWKAIECGAAEKMRMYAENHNYDVKLEDLVNICWTELCYQMIPKNWDI